jgi:hypothetical protein
MVNNREKKSLKDIISNHPITIITSIIITTVIMTSAVLIFAYEKFVIEHYKFENLRLEKILDQRDKINNLNSIANSFRNIIETQTKIVESKPSNNQIPIRQKNLIHNWDTLINNFIVIGKSLLKSDPTDNKNFELFNNWRNECLAFLNQVDFELKTNYANNFSTLTKLDRADYPQLTTKINDGLSIIKIIKLNH